MLKNLQGKNRSGKRSTTVETKLGKKYLQEKNQNRIILPKKFYAI